jgi:hypothetical protein
VHYILYLLCEYYHGYLWDVWDWKHKHHDAASVLSKCNTTKQSTALNNVAIPFTVYHILIGYVTTEIKYNFVTRLYAKSFLLLQMTSRISTNRQHRNKYSLHTLRQICGNKYFTMEVNSEWIHGAFWLLVDLYKQNTPPPRRSIRPQKKLTDNGQRR